MIDIFELPEGPQDPDDDARLGRALVRAWRASGAFQVTMNAADEQVATRASASGWRFFAQSDKAKVRCVSDATYAGYAAPGEHVTGDQADQAEIFTVCQDIAPDDPRARERWPGHGPVPWPDAEFRRSTLALMDLLGTLGDRLLRLIALGLGLDDPDAFARLTWGGWDDMRLMRLPRRPAGTRGIGPCTDHGLLTIMLHDTVGGLRVHPPAEGARGSRTRPSGELAAGVFAVLPGDVLEFATGDVVTATTYEVVLDARERFAIAYTHAPNFQTCVRPLSGGADDDDCLHYGSRFTHTYMRRYPHRAATKRILQEDRLTVLEKLRREATMAGSRL